MLKKIEISGSGVRPVSIDLTKRNLVVGDHGVGKSTVLDAITILIEGKSPRGGDRLEDIIGMMPESSTRMTITGEFLEGTIISRIFDKLPDKNTQQVYIDGKKSKLTDVASKIDEIIGNLSVRFNMGQLLGMTVPDQKKFIMKQFGNHLNTLNTDKIKADALAMMYMENEVFIGKMRFLIGKQDPSDLTTKEFDELYKMMMDTMSPIEQEKYGIIKLQVDMVKGDPEEVAKEIVTIIKDLKNDIDKEIKALQKEIVGYRKNVTAAGDVEQIKKDIAVREKDLSSLGIEKERLSIYNEHKKKVAHIDDQFKNVELKDDKDVLLKIKTIEDKLSSKKAILDKISEMEIYISHRKRDIENHQKVGAYRDMLKQMDDPEKLRQGIDNFKILGEEELKGKIDRRNFLIKSGDAIRDESIKYGQEITSLEKDIKSIDETIKLLSGGSCPVCSTPTENLGSFIAGKEKEKEAIEKSIAKLIKKKDAQLKKYKKSISDQSKIQHEITIETDRINKQKAELENMGYAEKSLLENIGRAEKQIKNLPYSGIVIETIEKYKVEIEKLKKLLATYEPVEKELSEAKAELQEIKNAKDKFAEKQKLVKELEMIKLPAYSSEEINNKTVLLTDMISSLKAKHETAIENRTSMKIALEAEAKHNDLQTIFETFKAMHKKMEEFHISLFATALKGITEVATQIYQTVTKTTDVVIITADKLGIKRAGEYINMKYLGGAESCHFYLSIIGAIMDDINLPVKMVNFESGELMDSELLRVLEEIKDNKYFDQINIVAYTRIGINASTKVDGWNIIGM